jgi:hypothetical protein
MVSSCLRRPELGERLHTPPSIGELWVSGRRVMYKLILVIAGEIDSILFVNNLVFKFTMLYK